MCKTNNSLSPEHMLFEMAPYLFEGRLFQRARISQGKHMIFKMARSYGKLTGGHGMLRDATGASRGGP